jgi:hypothetical protein
MKKLGIIGIIAAIIVGAGYIIFERLGGKNPMEITLKFNFNSKFF